MSVLEIIMLLQVEHKPHISIPRKRLGQVRHCSVPFWPLWHRLFHILPYIPWSVQFSPINQRNPIHIFVGTQALQFDILHWHIATQALQFDMDLECRIEAYPPPAIRWWDRQNHQMIIRWSSDDCQMIIRWSSELSDDYQNQHLSNHNNQNPGEDMKLALN